jgi:hypothetical protein
MAAGHGTATRSLRLAITIYFESSHSAKHLYRLFGIAFACTTAGFKRGGTTAIVHVATQACWTPRDQTASGRSVTGDLLGDNQCDQRTDGSGGESASTTHIQRLSANQILELYEENGTATRAHTDGMRKVLRQRKGFNGIRTDVAEMIYMCVLRDHSHQAQLRPNPGCFSSPQLGHVRCQQRRPTYHTLLFPLP